MTKKERIAYIAGIIDGEGYVGIKKSTWGMRNRKDVHCPTYHERIQIRMACRPVLELIKAEFGGSLGTEPRVYQSVSGFNSTKIMSIYRATDKIAANIIIAVSPFLIEKKEQAKAILALRRSKNSKLARHRGSPAKRKMKQSVLNYREKLYLRVKSLHK